MTDAAKITAMKSALHSEAMVLSAEGKHTAANAIKDLMWHGENDDLARLFDRIQRVAALA